MPIRVEIQHPCKNPLMAIDLLSPLPMSIIYWHNSHNYFNFLSNMLHDLTFKPMSLAQGSFFYKNGAPKALKFLLFEFFMFIVISNNLYNLSNFQSDLIYVSSSKFVLIKYVSASFKDKIHLITKVFCILVSFRLSFIWLKSVFILSQS